MTTPDDDPAALFRAALEEHAANMTTDEFRAFTMRVRPPGETQPLAQQPADPAQAHQQVMASLAAKRQTLPPVDANGYPVSPTSSDVSRAFDGHGQPVPSLNPSTDRTERPRR
ncbi:hypothetical protein [Mycobacterium palustre]|uniref:Uncharacterized protein n=1 Tax=Mycobacterium palustre TaxID=153971 RepID=A0A1X1ZWJ6_9MYCO|nr:hypothetical protein [Mycobacterium palustre]MCV7101538.1 hypothetical protein [Mycobacterium palustre]ORW28181.1 hypothetical protein AWC19_27485 [Mycobacterium palustre]